MLPQRARVSGGAREMYRFTSGHRFHPVRYGVVKLSAAAEEDSGRATRTALYATNGVSDVCVLSSRLIFNIRAERVLHIFYVRMFSTRLKAARLRLSTAILYSVSSEKSVCTTRSSLSSFFLRAALPPKSSTRVHATFVSRHLSGRKRFARQKQSR